MTSLTDDGLKSDGFTTDYVDISHSSNPVDDSHRWNASPLPLLLDPNDTTAGLRSPWFSSGAASSVSLHYSLATMILVALLLFVVILSTALGNLLVFVALFRSRYLRTVSNYLIGNLALSDFLLATTILPLSTVNECLGHWVFGRALCNFWLIMDVLYCTASIWNLCVIAFDRFTATLYPIWYRDKRSARQAGIYAALVWVISATICVPPLLGWNDLSQNYVYDDATEVHHCILFQTRSYVVYSAFGSFYVPFIVTLCLYVRIFVVLRARIKKTPYGGFRGALNTTASVRCGGDISQQETTMNEAPLVIDSGASKGSSCPRLVRANAVCIEGDGGGQSASSDPSLHRGQSDSETVDQRSPVGHDGCHGRSGSRDDPVLSLDDQSIGGQSLASIDHGQPSMDADHARRPFASSYRLKLKSAITRNVKKFPRRQEAFDLSARSTPPHLSSSSAAAAAGSVSSIGQDQSISAAERRRKFLFSRKSCQSLAPEAGSRSTSQRQRYEQREMRATIRMSIIIAFFCGMWVGFFTVYMVHGCCPECFIPRALDALFFWLGYSNSSVNPILYTIFNEEFRRAFQKILGWYTHDNRKLSSRK